MCAVCENDPDPISMPCGHSMCVNCVRECGNQGNSPLCPVCRMTIPMHFNIKLLSGADVSSKVNKDIYMAFKLQCNSFFMDLVMRFCFAEGQPPGAEVLKCRCLSVLYRRQKVIYLLIASNVPVKYSNIMCEGGGETAGLHYMDFKGQG
jgi:hypothetical protein